MTRITPKSKARIVSAKYGVNLEIFTYSTAINEGPWERHYGLAVDSGARSAGGASLNRAQLEELYAAIGDILSVGEFGKSVANDTTEE